MITNEEKYTTVYVNLFFNDKGKHENIDRLRNIIADKLNLETDKFGDIYSNYLEYEIKKNQDYNKTEEKNGDYMQYYFTIYLDARTDIPWDIAFKAICDTIVTLREMGASAVPAGEHDEAFNRSIGHDSFAKL